MSRTTLLGALAAILMSTQIDFEKLARFDRAELARVGFAVVVGLLGKFAADQKLEPVAK